MCCFPRAHERNSMHTVSSTRVNNRTVSIKTTLIAIIECVHNRKCIAQFMLCSCYGRNCASTTKTVATTAETAKAAAAAKQNIGDFPRDRKRVYNCAGSALGRLPQLRIVIREGVASLYAIWCMPLQHIGCQRLNQNYNDQIHFDSVCIGRTSDQHAFSFSVNWWFFSEVFDE